MKAATIGFMIGLVGAILALAPLAVVHELGLREALAERDAALELEAATAQRAEHLSREVRLAHTRQTFVPAAPLVLPEPEMAPLVLATLDGRRYAAICARLQEEEGR